MTTSPDAHPTDRDSVLVLADHHRTLDAGVDNLLARTKARDPVALQKEWTVFERELLRHMEMEEAEILPDFARHDPAEAHALLSEHCAIRNALLDIGINLDLHSLRAEAVDDFVQRLRAHARREDEVFYAWAKSNVPASRWQAIRRGLKNAISRRPRTPVADRIM